MFFLITQGIKSYLEWISFTGISLVLALFKSVLSDCMEILHCLLASRTGEITPRFGNDFFYIFQGGKKAFWHTLVILIIIILTLSKTIK